MRSERERDVIKKTADRFKSLENVDVSCTDQSDFVISFTTTFSGNSAFDLQLSPSQSGLEVLLLTSSETPLMQDKIDTINENQIDSLLDHVVETLRELEGN